MNIDAYDIFSKVIPGGLLLTALMLCKWIPAEALAYPQIILLLIAYGIGHIIDALASQHRFEKLFGRKESEKQLDIKLDYKERHKDLEKIISKVGDSWEKKNLSLSFSRILREVKFDTVKRVQGFQNHHVNARNIFLTTILSAIPITTTLWQSDLTFAKKACFLLSMAGVVFLFWDRVRKRSRFYVKEVLDYYLYKDKK
jgi:hypothetical protein